MRPVLLTLSLVITSAIVAGGIGIPWGWGLARMRRPGTRRNFLADLALFAPLLMLALPVYVHAAGWEAAAGKFGWLPLIQGGPRQWFFGLVAGSWIHGTYGACWVALATTLALRHTPLSTRQAATLEATLWQRDRLILLPLASGWFLAAIIWCSIVAATEYTVANLYGLSTLADEVYKVYALAPQAVPVLNTVLFPFLILTPGIVWVSRRLHLWNEAKQASDEIAPSNEKSSLQLDSRSTTPTILWLASTLVILSSIGVALVPLLSLVIKAGWTVEQVNGDNVAAFSWSQTGETLALAPRVFFPELSWTLLLAALSSVTYLLIAGFCASLAEDRPRLRMPFLLITASLAMIPGPVVSLFVIWLFNRPSLGYLYDRTLVPTLVAIAPRAFPIGYLLLRGNYRLLDGRTNQCARIDGCSWPKRVWLIDAPRIRRGIALAGLCIALVAIGDLSATLLVLPPSVTTVASRLFGLLHSGVRNQEAGLALVTVFCVGIITAGLKRLVR